MFDHKSREYSARNAASSAYISQLCYESRRVCIQKSFTLGFDSTFFEKGDTQALLLDAKDYIVIGFRGTEMEMEKEERTQSKSYFNRALGWALGMDLDDIMTDLDFWKTPGPFGGKVHEGFLKAFDKVWIGSKGILKALDAIMDRRGRIPIFVTGHSLGAALSVMCAAHMQESNYHVQGVYLFGCPRTGGKYFTESYDLLCSRTWRVVQNNDLVSRIPPALFGYYHCGNLVYITHDKRILHSPSAAIISDDRSQGRIQDFGDGDLDGIGDHSCDGYVKAMMRQLSDG